MLDPPKSEHKTWDWIEGIFHVPDLCELVLEVLSALFDLLSML